MTSDKSNTVAVIGAGSFGTAVANLLAKNTRVYLYSRNPEVVDEILKTRKHRSVKIHENIIPTHSLEEVCIKCSILFPVVPSSNFRNLIKNLSEHLRPYHILIHGTKGLDIKLPANKTIDDIKFLGRDKIRTMSEVITDESPVVRIGCLAGPNLAKELNAEQPAATVVASPFQEVINLGQKYLRNDKFQVYGNKDLLSIELSGVLKNIIAIAAGAIHGLGLGENAKGLLISRGMIEVIYLGKHLGGKTTSFLGLAGIGDLVATCNSLQSRNFTVGTKLAKGESLEEIIDSMDEVAEGINTIKLIKKFADEKKFAAPITETLYKIITGEMTAKEGLEFLMKFPQNVDISFLRKEFL